MTRYLSNATRWMAVAGITAPAGFIAVALVHSQLRPEHRLVPDPISALAAGPTGWVQNLTFVITGALLAAFAIGLHRGLQPVRAGVAGPALLALSGLGLVWAGLFPATDAAGAFTDDRVLHTIAPVGAFLGAGGGLFVLSWRLAADPAWRRLTNWLLLAVWFPAVVVLAVRLRNVTAAAGARPTTVRSAR